MSSSAVQRPGVWIKTFGCQMNAYDSEKMLRLLAADYREVASPEDAELALINTCSVREKGEHKLFSMLGRLRDLKERNPNFIIGVGGCVAQQEGKQIIKRNSAVDFVVGTHNLSLIPSLVSQAKHGASANVAVDYREEWEELPHQLDEDPQSDTEPFRALVAIQRGCNKNCTFCVVPKTRGSQVSRGADEILREVKLKALRGAKEVLLLGQTVNSYGIDLKPRQKFEDLIRRIANVEGVHRIRFTSPHPQEVKPSFIELYGEIPQLVPHIHLPLQSGSNRILKAMNRNYRVERYLEIVESLRDCCPDIAISTDIIVGFPGESEEDFEQTLDVMRKAKYSMSYSFVYSKRPDTVAEALEESLHLPLETSRKRLAVLHDLQDQLSAEVNQQWIGKSVEVLVEGKLKKISSAMRGRIPQNTLVELQGGDKIAAGSIVQVKVTHSSSHGLRGQVTDSL